MLAGHLETPMLKHCNRAWVCALALLAGAASHAADGLVAVKSAHPPKATLDRFEATAKERGLMVFARIDHAAGAQRWARRCDRREVLIFGNPQGGTPLMECAQSAGIDLPLKALAWVDAQGQSWLGYNDPAWLATRHGAASCPVVDNLRKALSGLAEAATAK